MEVKLRDQIGLGVTHEERLAVAHRIVELCLMRHGREIAAIGIYGSTAVDKDLPYSDLDMTVVTYSDLDDQTKCYHLNGLTVELDYQTVTESMKDEANVPGEGGCWASFLGLYDPDGVLTKLKNMYELIDENTVREEFAKRMRDQLCTYVGKARNAVLSDDRAGLIQSAQSFGIEFCRALQILNRHYTTGQAALRSETKQLPELPSGFSDQIDISMGTEPASDNDIYNAIEELYVGMKDLASKHNINWLSTDIEI